MLCHARGYWQYPTIPAVDRFKFVTRGKFMVNVCDRWAKSKTQNLQAAWFNGAGYETWENVWGAPPPRRPMPRVR
jgi:hypothetical protein